MASLKSRLNRDRPYSIISNALEDMQFTNHINRDTNLNNREHWLASEIAQILRYAFSDDSQTTVWINTPHGQVKPDLNVTGTYDGHPRAYPIEIKRTAQSSALDALESQMKRLRNQVPNFTRGFVFFYVEDEESHPDNNSHVNGLVRNIENQDYFDYTVKTMDSVKSKF